MNLEYIALRIDDFDELRIKAKAVDDLRKYLQTCMDAMTNRDLEIAEQFSEERAKGMVVAYRSIADGFQLFVDAPLREMNRS